MFETALERNLIYTANLPEKGKDVTQQYLDAKAVIPMGFTKVLLTKDADGVAVFRASN